MLKIMRILGNKRQLKEFAKLQNSKEKPDDFQKNDEIEKITTQRITKHCLNTTKKLLKEKLKL